MQKLPGVFGAEMVPGGNFATKMALFGAELWRRRGSWHSAKLSGKLIW